MKQVITTERIPIKLWLDDMEEEALQQAKNLANLPFAFSHISIMPDSHLGYGMPIGGVLATENIIIPNAVGVDIGCGMCAQKTNLTHIETEDLKKIMGLIRERVPVGFNHQKKRQDPRLMPTYPYSDIVNDEYEKALYQLGTLGGGNHFIEIQKGDDGFIWIMVHSGSRNFGYRVAKYYNDLSKNLNEQWFSSVPKEHQLAFLPLYSEEGQMYLEDMTYCVEFALANRSLMMGNIMKSMLDILGHSWVPDGRMINIAHNYAKLENHFNKNVVVHRKGATSAYEGEIGIIPGSQGTSSYIVKGKGEPQSFKSCSHGAGRKMGRKKAQKTLSLEDEKKILDDQGIIHGIRNKSDLDEAPSAYKDIDVVMENQKDLVEILVKLKPLAVIKG